MSFLAGRLAGKEGAYFFQESKQAVTRLAAAQKKNPSPAPPSSPNQASSPGADVLPEVLRHSLPPELFRETQASPSYYAPSKWSLRSGESPFGDGVSANPSAVNPLRDYVSLPQVTLGPKRWQLPSSNGWSGMASTANELRQQQDPTPMDPEKLKAAAEGLSQIGKAFAVATMLVFGGTALLIGMASSKLEWQNYDDIRTSMRDLVAPKNEVVKKKLEPLKIWADNASKKWHFERNEEVKENRMAKELSKIWGAKSPN